MKICNAGTIYIKCYILAAQTLGEALNQITGIFMYELYKLI